MKAVAVLAFANLIDDKANEYFSDGISEELLNVLCKVPGLKVTARTSATGRRRWSWRRRCRPSSRSGRSTRSACWHWRESAPRSSDCCPVSSADTDVAPRTFRIAMSATDSKAVFLSYASQDGEPARRIAETLRASGGCGNVTGRRGGVGDWNTARWALLPLAGASGRLTARGGGATSAAFFAKRLVVRLELSALMRRPLLLTMNQKTKTFHFVYPGVFPGGPLVPAFVLSQDAPVDRDYFEKQPEKRREIPARKWTRAVISLPKAVRRLVPQSL